MRAVETRETKKNRKKASSELEQRKSEIFEQWKSIWKSDDDQIYSLAEFYNLFVSNYQYVLASKKWNKYENEHWKKIFVLVIVCGIGYIGWIMKHTAMQGGGAAALLENTLFLIPLVMAGGAVSKWIDIKKYQETWVRHSEHLHLLLVEMLKFISGMAPYDCSDRKAIFARNVLNIWDKNQTKFLENMENKEKGLMDIFEKVK